MQIPILVALAVYAAVVLTISLYWMRKIKLTTDFLMARRTLGFFPLLGSILATGIGTGVALGASGVAYESGWGGCLYPIGLGAGIMIGAIWAEMRNYGFMTLSEEIACYYGGNAVIYNFSNVALFLAKVCWLTVQIMGGGFVLSVITGLSPKTCTVLSGILIAVTTIPGGLLTVVYTDIFQVIVLFAGFIVLCIVSLQMVGGLDGLEEKVPPEYFSFLGVEALGWKTAVSIALALVIHKIADTNNRLRIYSAVSVRAAKWSLLLAGGFEIAFSVIIGIVGMSAYALGAQVDAADQAIPWLTVHALPTWLAAVVVVAITAAIFSSGDSDAAVSATFFVRHIFPMFAGRFPDNPLLVSRLWLVILFIVSTVLGLLAGSIVDFVLQFLSVILSGLAVVIVLGRFWKRATWQGAVTAVVAGAVVSFLVMWVPGQEEFWGKPIIPATLAALVGEVGVSLLTPAPKTSFREVAENMRDQRAAIDSDTVFEAFSETPGA